MISMLLTAILQTTPVVLPLSEVEGAPPSVLAPKILPPDVARTIEGGFVRRQFVPSPIYVAGFWERPTVYRPGLCARRIHVVEIANREIRVNSTPQTPLTVGEVRPSTQYALSSPCNDCTTATGWIGSTDANSEATLQMLTRLGQAVEQAKGRERLPFDLQCTGESPTACRNARAALATLPVSQLLSIRLQNTAYREEPPANGVHVRYMQPVVDGRWPQAEASFDASAPDGRSWTVLLKGVDRLEAVEMRRTTIIRH